MLAKETRLEELDWLPVRWLIPTSTLVQVVLQATQLNTRDIAEDVPNADCVKQSLTVLSYASTIMLCLARRGKIQRLLSY